MRLLVVHQNFPGQFGHLVKEWASRPGWVVRALGRETAPGLAGFDQLVRYELARKPHSTQHRYLRQMESAVLHGQASARAMLELRKGGFIPDVILAHPGWGESLFAKDVYPDARLVHYCEWFYTPEAADVGFDPEFPSTFDDHARIRTWNALHALNLTHCDAAVTPTRWQRSRHPSVFQPKIEVQHEGIAIDELKPDSSASIELPNGARLDAGDPVLTYVARNLEPYRGFHIFMRALQRAQERDSRLQAIVVGGDDVSYGKRPTGARNWRERMLREVRIDPARTHFVGRVPREKFVRILQVSAAHVYLTYPFVLSWSLLEAMACECRIIASDTMPVREVIRDGVNGKLFDFFDVQRLAELMVEAASDPRQGIDEAKAARKLALQFDRTNGLFGYDWLLFGDTSQRHSLKALLQADEARHDLSTEERGRARRREPIG